MKILFLKSVPRQGQAGEVKDLSQGFAAFIIKSGAGVVATDAVIKQNAKKIEETKLKSKGEESYAYGVAEKLKDTEIKIKGGANNKGSLYKAIHRGDVIEAMNKVAVINVPENLLEDISIKLTGKYPIKMTYKGKNLGEFTLVIE